MARRGTEAPARRGSVTRKRPANCYSPTLKQARCSPTLQYLRFSTVEDDSYVRPSSCRRKRWLRTSYALAVVCTNQHASLQRQAGPRRVAKRSLVPVKPGNSDGAKGPRFERRKGEGKDDVYTQSDKGWREDVPTGPTAWRSLRGGGRNLQADPGARRKAMAGRTGRRRCRALSRNWPSNSIRSHCVSSSPPSKMSLERLAARSTAGAATTPYDATLTEFPRILICPQDPSEFRYAGTPGFLATGDIGCHLWPPYPCR